MAATKRIQDRRFKRPKKNRISSTEEFIINSKYIGEEPVHDGHVLTDTELGKIYSWYSYMCSAADARDYIVDYMNKLGKKQIARQCAAIPDGRVPTTAGWICRTILRGGLVTERSKLFLIDRITKAIAIKEDDPLKTTKKEKQKVEKIPVDIQANIRERARDIIGGIETLIDKGDTFSTYEYLQKNMIPPTYSTFICDFYIKMVLELEEVLEGTDLQLKEAYSRYTKQRVKKMLEMYKSIIHDATIFGENAKKVRKANRKPKTISTEKLLRNFKYKKNDQEYKLVSIDPQQIFASQELWTFNTKTRILTVYRAQDQSGLGVKTVNITGFADTTSFSKKLRKPEQVLSKILSSGKVTLKNIMNEITSKNIVCKPRISSDTILLKVVKL